MIVYDLIGLTRERLLQFMAHNLIVGMTESGKSTLAKLMAKEFRARGIKVAVLDPLRDNWQADFQTTDSDEFLKYAKANKSHVLIVDEGPEAIGKYNREMNWLATVSRHFGHASIFITQRATEMSATIRHQCSKVFIFACGENDTEMFAEEWREPALRGLAKIGPGEFFIVSRFDQIRKGRVDFTRQTVIME